jgi:hypothetical protein
MRGRHDLKHVEVCQRIDLAGDRSVSARIKHQQVRLSYRAVRFKLCGTERSGNERGQ